MASKASLECADVILRRNFLPPSAWSSLRRDIAKALDLAEAEKDKAWQAKLRKAEAGRRK